MAEQIDLFKKEFAKLRKEIDEGTHDLAHVDSSISKLRSVSTDLENEFRQHGMRLRATGFKGVTLAEFLKDDEAAKLHANLMTIVKALEEQNRKGMIAAQKARASLSKLTQLQSGIDTEIKNRKKQVSTKIGIGNKSLPEMEKLLTELHRYAKDDKDRETIVNFESTPIRFYTKDSEDSIKKAIERINKDEPPPKEYEYSEQLLEPRLIGGVYNKARILYETIIKADDDAALQKSKAKDLLNLTEKYGRLKVGSATRAKFKRDPDGAKVEKFYDALIKMRGVAERHK